MLHSFDVWHGAKNLGKKIHAVSAIVFTVFMDKCKVCIQEYVKAILSTRLYSCAVISAFFLYLEIFSAVNCNDFLFLL